MTLKQWKKEKKLTYQQILDDINDMPGPGSKKYKILWIKQVFTGKGCPGRDLLLKLVGLTGMEVQEILNEKKLSPSDWKEGLYLFY